MKKCCESNLFICAGRGLFILNSRKLTHREPKCANYKEGPSLKKWLLLEIIVVEFSADFLCSQI